MDSLDDVFADGATKDARATGKFQPKLKPRSQKVSSAPIHSTQCQSSIEKQEKELVDGNKIEKPPRNSGDLVLQAPSLDENSRCEMMKPSMEQFFVAEEGMVSMTDLHTNIGSPGGVEDWHSCLGKSGTENTDIFLGFESLDDLLTQPSSTVTVDSESRSPTRVNLGPQTEGNCSALFSISTKKCSKPLPETSIAIVPDSGVSREPLGRAIVSSDDQSAWVPCASHARISSNLTEPNFNTCFQEINCFSDAGDLHIDNGRLETEDAGQFSSLEVIDIPSELTSTSGGKKSGKFQPKPKLQSRKDDNTVISNLRTLEPLSQSTNAQALPSATEYIDDGSIVASPIDDVDGFSSEAIITNSVSEHVENIESTDFATISFSEPAVPADHLNTKVSQRAKTRQTKPLADCSQKNGVARSLRPRTKRVDQHEFLDGAKEGGETSNDSPTDLFMTQDGSDSDEFQVEENLNKKRVQRKSKKDVSEQSTEKRPKRFSHSTRQNRRHLDKVLLQTPEDEIDYRNLCMRDLILLAEHKERISKEGTSKTLSMNQSNGTQAAPFGEDIGFTSVEGEHSDEEAGPSLDETLYHFNYQTYMNKTPSTRWSKQDTELFYEAVRQFGSDFSMIQQLFPDRTRRQVLLKFKKEERQHPLQFRDALTNRAKDNTHFQLVIERLQKIAAEEKQKSNADDSIDLTFEDDPPCKENDEVVKLEKNDQTKAGDAESVVPEAQNSQKPEESEEDEDSDEYRWSNYKSEV